MSTKPAQGLHYCQLVVGKESVMRKQMAKIRLQISESGPCARLNRFMATAEFRIPRRLYQPSENISRLRDLAATHMRTERPSMRRTDNKANFEPIINHLQFILQRRIDDRSLPFQRVIDTNIKQRRCISIVGSDQALEPAASKHRRRPAADAETRMNN